MFHERTVLGLDTAGRHCSVAVVRHGEVVSSWHFNMERGQAETLFPTIDRALDEAGCSVHDLAAIGVGTGPGSFTGIRFGVAAARGLALALRIPAVGISAFDLVAHGSREPTLAVLEAPNGQLFAKPCPDGDPVCIESRQLKDRFGSTMPVAGDRSGELAVSLGTSAFSSPATAGAAAALIAAQRLPWRGPRPEPCYLRPAVLDAARFSAAN